MVREPLHVAPRHALAGIGHGAVGHVLGEHVDDKQSVRPRADQRQGIILAQAREREHADDLESTDVRRDKCHFCGVTRTGPLDLT